MGRDLDYAIRQPNQSCLDNWCETNSIKMCELNIFLQERKVGRIGNHVIDVAKELIESLEVENKCYRETLEKYAMTSFGQLARETLKEDKYEK